MLQHISHTLNSIDIKTDSKSPLNPLEGDIIKCLIKFKINNNTKPFDSFSIKISKDLMCSYVGDLNFYDEKKRKIAQFSYDYDRQCAVYTFTDYVEKHKNIKGGLLYYFKVNSRIVTKNTENLKCMINIDNYNYSFFYNVKYSQNKTYISSGITDYNLSKEIITEIFYVTPKNLDLKNVTLLFNSNSNKDLLVSRKSTRVEIYDNPFNVNLPESFDVNHKYLKNISCQFPVVEEDMFVDKLNTVSFKKNQMKLNLPLNKSSTYIIKIVTKVDSVKEKLVIETALADDINKNNKLCEFIKVVAVKDNVRILNQVQIQTFVIQKIGACLKAISEPFLLYCNI